MPSVIFKSIESFSSEDSNHPATNLLKPGNKKWKCREAGEKSAFVIIRLEEPVQISGIDIGNEHSAFIEALVARSGPSNPKFTELLLATKFMNTVDSRNSTSPNRVQFFNTSALVRSVAQEKWDLVKIICTQPFNARVQYGLTFVVVHTASVERKQKSLIPEGFQLKIREEAAKDKASNMISFGRFKLREESPDSDVGGAAGGSLNVFARWKEKLKPNSLTVATSVSALMRDSRTPEAVQKNIPTPGSVRNVVTHRPKPQRFDSSDDEANPQKGGAKTNRNNESLLYDEEDDKKPRESIGHQSKQNQEKPKADASMKKTTKLHDVASSKFKEFLNITGQSMDRESKRSNDSKNESPIKPTHVSPPSDKPFDKVRTPLSIEKQIVPKKRLSSPKPSSDKRESCSPSNKKQKVFSAEASSTEEVTQRVQYKPFGKLLENVVLVISGIQNPERGQIRSQALAMGAKYKPDWDSSCTHLICAYKNTPKYNQVRGKGKIIKKEWIETCYNNRKRFSWRKFAMDTEQANASDSEDEIVDIVNKPAETNTIMSVEDRQDEAVMLHELVGSDSEDDAMPAKKIYDISTEDEGEHNSENSTENKDFFKDKKFYLDPELGTIDIIKLEKYIRSFKGHISDAMHGVDYVITRNKLPMPAFCRAELVKPLWVYECNEMECLIPIQRYRV